MGAAVREEVEEKFGGAGLGCGTARGAGAADDGNSGVEVLSLGAMGVVEHVGRGGADEQDAGGGEEGAVAESVFGDVGGVGG